MRGIRPFLDQQRVLAASTGPKKTGPRLRGTDKSAAARGRNVLEQSFGQLPQQAEPFAGRRQELAQIRQWVQAARASTETQPTVVVLHGTPGSGRTTLAVHATHELKDYFRGACVVDLRAEGLGESPLSTRDALLHLLNRLGAPREQLLFRERSSPDQQVKRLSELYHQHLTGLPVTVVLDDASDAAQVRALVPERSDSLVLVTARGPLELDETAGAGAPAGGASRWTRRALRNCWAPRRRTVQGRTTPSPPTRSGSCAAGCRWRCASRGRASARARPRALATDLGAYGPVEPVERALWLRYTDQSETVRRLLRRLALAGRASLGAAAAAALLATDEAEAKRHLAGPDPRRA